MKCLTKRAQIASLCEILLAERVTKYRASDGGVASLTCLSIKSLSQHIYHYDMIFCFLISLKLISLAV